MCYLYFQNLIVLLQSLSDTILCMFFVLFRQNISFPGQAKCLPMIWISWSQVLRVLAAEIPVVVLQYSFIEMWKKNIEEWKRYFTRDALVQRVPFFGGEFPFTTLPSIQDRYWNRSKNRCWFWIKSSPTGCSSRGDLKSGTHHLKPLYIGLEWVSIVFD